MPETGEPDAAAVVSLRLDPRGFLQLAYEPGTRVTEAVAVESIRRADQVNGARRRPVVVDMQGTTEITRAARHVFAQPCSVTAVALLGSSRVDRVVAAFAIAVTDQAAPTRYFTSREAAERWVEQATDGG